MTFSWTPMTREKPTVLPASRLMRIERQIVTLNALCNDFTCQVLLPGITAPVVAGYHANAEGGQQHQLFSAGLSAVARRCRPVGGIAHTGAVMRHIDDLLFASGFHRCRSAGKQIDMTGIESAGVVRKCGHGDKGHLNGIGDKGR